MRTIVTSFMLFCISLCSFGQSSSEIKSRINDIKRSSSYLSAEATMATPEESMNTAKELLVQEINEWISTKRKGGQVKNVVLQDINTYTQRLDMKRGVKTRAFVFVKKKDIVLIFGNGQIVLNEDEKGNDLKTLSSVSDNKKEEVEAQKEQKTVIAEKESEKEVDAAPQAKLTSETALQSIMKAGTMSEMKNVFASLKAEGMIEYGVFKSSLDKGTCYLLFYSKEGVVKGVVKKVGNYYSDPLTGQKANVMDYNGNGVYWFTLK